MKNLYYKLTDDGYHIYDYNDEFFHIHQYEPYIIDRTRNYEENAKMQIREFMIDDYALEIYSNNMSINEVPEDYYQEVLVRVEQMKAMEKPTTTLTETKEKAIAYDILMGVNE